MENTEKLACAILLALAAQTSLAFADCRKVIVSGDPDYPPLVWHDELTLRGAAIDIVTAALDRIHLPYEIKYVGPFLRVLESARNGKVDLIVEMKKNADREEFLRFPETPIFMNPVAVFVRADRKFKYKKWGDLGSLRGGITLGNKFGGGFDEYLEEHLKYEAAPTIESNFEKLKNDRIDYFVTGYYPGTSHLIENGTEAQFRVLKPFVTSSENFVGWSKGSACVGKLEEFDAALRALVKAGKTEAILTSSVSNFRRYLRRVK